MNKYKDMSNTELFKIYESRIRYYESALIRRSDFNLDELLFDIEAIKQEILSRMIPRESIKLTVK